MEQQRPSDDVEVRLLKREDFDDVVRIDHSVFGRERSEYYENRFATALDRSDRMVTSLVAEVEGNVVGFVMGELYLGEFGIPETTASVDSIGVDPGFQHRGVGVALMEEFVRNMRVAGVERIYTRVFWNDLPLIRFFNSAGFAPSKMINLELEVD
jgi:ribosomal protein S18 acetylase RimI-like enzyme